MIKPKRLQRGDTVAIVSLSSGILGEPEFVHKFELGKKYLEEEFGLKVVTMPNALKGVKYLYEHPELRARDWMEACQDDSIAGIICAIGGDDTIRLLPYIDFEVLKTHPKILLGYSDTTANHLMMYHAGVMSYYGPALMSDFAEYGGMFEYTKQAVQRLLFESSDGYQIMSSNVWSNDFIEWSKANQHRKKRQIPELHGYELLQGKGKVKGRFLGGCLDALIMYIGTKIWPNQEEWKDKILFLETSEDCPSPEMVRWILRNLAAQGIFQLISAVIVAKPMNETYYDEYKEVFCQVIAQEEHRNELPIFYNVNFGHATPNGVIPYGIEAEFDCEQMTITLLESAVQ